MTAEQQAAIKALGGCTFLPGSFDKRFVRNVSARLDRDPARPLTDRQAEQLTRLLHRYRRQHKACTCEACTGETNEEPFRKAGCGDCLCGGVGTLFARRGSGKPPVCAVCAGIMRPGPAPLPTPHSYVPLPAHPYPWLMEERLDRDRLRRVCLGCGESMEATAERNGRSVRFPCFMQWFREHSGCGNLYRGEAEAR